LLRIRKPGAIAFVAIVVIFATVCLAIVTVIIYVKRFTSMFRASNRVNYVLPGWRRSEHRCRSSDNCYADKRKCQYLTSQQTNEFHYIHIPFMMAVK